MKTHCQPGLSLATQRYRRQCVTILLGATVLLLAACTQVGPDFKKPEVSVAEGWLEAADDRISIDDGDQREWWKTC